MSRCVLVGLATILTACLAIAALAVAAPARRHLDIRVLAHVPPPGYPSGTVIGAGGTIYAGTFQSLAASDSRPSKVFAYSPSGRLERGYTVRGQAPGAGHAVVVATHDARGRLYLLDQQPSRVVVLDPRTGAQRTWARFRDVPTCSSTGGHADCSDTVMDNPPEPVFGAWGPDGALYVPDYQQGLIWRVAPGGGRPTVWYTDPRLDGAVFGPDDIVLAPDHRSFLIDTTAGPVTGPDPTSGKLYRLRIGRDGRPGALRRLYESGPREGPTGFALARSGNVYLTLVGPGVNQLVEISPGGRELARVPATPLANQRMAVPFDSPSSARFDGERLIVTNEATFTGDQAHMVLFDVYAGERGAPIYIPPAPRRYRLRVAPDRVRAGHRVRLRFHATVTSAGHTTAARGVVHVAGRRAATDRHGRVSVALTFRHAGVRRPSLQRRSGGRALARARVVVTRPRRSQPRFAG